MNIEDYVAYVEDLVADIESEVDSALNSLNMIDFNIYETVKREEPVEPILIQIVEGRAYKFSFLGSDDEKSE